MILDSRFRGNDWVGGLQTAVCDPGVDMCPTRFPLAVIPVETGIRWGTGLPGIRNRIIKKSTKKCCHSRESGNPVRDTMNEGQPAPLPAWGVPGW